MASSDSPEPESSSRITPVAPAESPALRTSVLVRTSDALTVRKLAGSCTLACLRPAGKEAVR